MLRYATRIIVVLLLICLSAAPATGQSTGAISGTITDAATGTPLAGMRVDVYNEYGGWLDASLSDAAGAYSVSGLTTGKYHLKTLNAFPYLDELYENLPCLGGSCVVTTGKGINVTAGLTTAGIDFQLQMGGTITGTVTDAITHAPLSNILVGAHYANGVSTGGAIGTNLAGVYTIGGLPTGTYYVRTVISYPYFDELYDNLPCPTGNCTPQAGTGVSVTAGSTTSGIDFGLMRGGTITGTVTTAASGVPRPDVRVDAYTASGQLASQAWSNGSGVYALGGLETGTYYVRAWNSYPYLGELYNNVSCPAGNCTLTEGTGVSVTTDATTAGINFSLALGGTITGIVTARETGAPIVHAGVGVFAANRESAGVGWTDAAGVYAVSGLAPGTYFVRAGSDSGYRGALYDNKPCHPDCDITTGTGVVVSAEGTTTSINFALDRSGVITGIVRDDYSGAPLANIIVTAFTSPGAAAGQTVTDASGSYSIPFLEPGTYYVRTQNAFPYLDELYDDRPCPASCLVTWGSPVSVSLNHTTSGIDFDLAGAGRLDFDGDRKSDILWRHGARGEVWLWSMDGAVRTLETHVQTVADTNWEIRGIADFTNDTKADVLWRNKASGEIYLWRMEGTVPLYQTRVATVDPAYDIVGTGDFNGDGRSDILWRHTTLGDVWVWLMDGAMPQAQEYIERVDPGYVVKGVGDLDRDGKADIVWHGATRGDVWVWPMNGTTRLDQVWVGTVPDVGYQVVGVADFTSDGKADLLWHHATRGEVWIWTMNGTAREAETWIETVPDTSYQIVATGDYNGDTKADILWHHAARGEVWVWLMDGTTKLSETWVATVPDVGYQIVRAR